jgi:hypothetical protein
MIRRCINPVGNLRASVCMRVFIAVRMRLNVFVCVYVSVYVCVCVCACVRLHVCVLRNINDKRQMNLHETLTRKTKRSSLETG